MRVLLLLFVSGLLLSQPVAKTDSTQSTNLPDNIQPTIDKIVANSEEIAKVEEATSKEMQKQLDLMLQIKKEVLKLQKRAKIQNDNSKHKNVKDSSEDKAIKEQQLLIEVEGQIVQWETRKRTWLGKFLNTEDILYYPYIIDKDGKKIYLK